MRTVWARAILATLLLLSSAAAEAASKRIGVPKFHEEGTKEAAVRKKVMQVLKAHGYELVRSHEIQGAMSRTGADVDSGDGLKTLAKEMALSAIVTGEVASKRAKLVVHDGADGSILGDASFAGANPAQAREGGGADVLEEARPRGRARAPPLRRQEAGDVVRRRLARGRREHPGGEGEGEATDDNDEGEASAVEGAASGGASGRAGKAPEKKEEESTEAASVRMSLRVAPGSTSSSGWVA